MLITIACAVLAALAAYAALRVMWALLQLLIFVPAHVAWLVWNSRRRQISPVSVIETVHNYDQRHLTINDPRVIVLQ